MIFTITNFLEYFVKKRSKLKPKVCRFVDSTGYDNSFSSRIYKKDIV